MKKYELLSVEIQNGNFSDVISTSADVTTEKIPWQNTTDPAYQVYQLSLPLSDAYDVD